MGRHNRMSAEDRQLVQDVYRDYLRAKGRLVEVQQQLLELMDERSALLTVMERTGTRALAQKMECSISQIHYVVRPRDGAHSPD